MTYFLTGFCRARALTSTRSSNISDLYTQTAGNHERHFLANKQEECIRWIWFHCRSIRESDVSFLEDKPNYFIPIRGLERLDRPSSVTHNIFTSFVLYATLLLGSQYSAVNKIDILYSGVNMKNPEFLLSGYQ